MDVVSYDPLYPVELQDSSWSCSAAALSWALGSMGIYLTEGQVVAGLGPSRINPQYGLLDATGNGLVSYLAEIGVGADNNADASWDDCVAAAGSQPMVIGGRAWNHWSGVRSSGYSGEPLAVALRLANPAPGWMAVFNILVEDDFVRLGAFSAVWLFSQ